MTKLSNDQLEVLVQKGIEAGVKHTVEVMNKEELAAYRNNCIEGINIRKNNMNKGNQGRVMQQIHAESIEVLEGYIAYIDAKLNEDNQEDVNVIDSFLNNWREKAFVAYSELRNEYDAIRKDFNKRNNFLNELSKQSSQIITHSAFERNLNDYLNFEVKKKKILLTQRITEKAGNIIDAKRLHVGNNGELNGTIIGDKAAVTVKTIYAGGYNIQSLHYRVLVNVIK